jgi:cell division protein ZapD
MIIDYEYPLNERIRTMLRLEDLYNKALAFSARPDNIDHHAALLILFEILEVASRADLKSDLLQEMERQKQVLDSLRRNPSVSEEALNKILAEIEKTSAEMLKVPGKIGQHMRDNEWLMSIKQRTGIPGGVCEFDLPSYHYWLNLDPAVRQQDLHDWLAPLLPIKDGLSIVLRVLRESGKVGRHVASQGVFQYMLAGRMAQMLRISLNRNFPCIPEISANKYAINIRFTTQAGNQRPKVYEMDVDFELTFCNL